MSHDESAEPGLPIYIPLVEASRRLAVSASSLKGWARTGEYGCPALHRIGPKVQVFREDELLPWIESLRQPQQGRSDG